MSYEFKLQRVSCWRKVHNGKELRDKWKNAKGEVSCDSGIVVWRKKQ